MADGSRRSDRRQHILETLAHMLEAEPGNRITTARLAAAVGVSEAALYRHFPSKTRMFEGLLEFIEETLFSRISLILEEQPSAERRCGLILGLLLTFAERNPGITRLLNGDALTGETARLHQRVAQLYERLETQLRLVLRDAELYEGLRTRLPGPTAANLLLATAEGRISQYVRGGFKRKPTEDWDLQWQQLMVDFFRPGT
jgi:TetR/AcrR family transcriptional regulator